MQAKAAGLGQAPGAEHAADVSQLQEEIRVLKQRVDTNPEVKRFAGELCLEASVLAAQCILSSSWWQAQS